MTARERTRRALVTCTNAFLFGGAGAWFFHSGGWSALITFFVVNVIWTFAVIVVAYARES